MADRVAADAGIELVVRERAVLAVRSHPGQNVLQRYRPTVGLRPESLLPGRHLTDP